MKVKIFTNTNTTDLEKELNAFCLSNEVVSISHSTSANSEQETVYSVIVLYKTKKGFSGGLTDLGKDQRVLEMERERFDLEIRKREIDIQKRELDTRL